MTERMIAGGLLEGINTLWDRDILSFFLVGWIMFGVGLLGEYVGRIYQQVRNAAALRDPRRAGAQHRARCGARRGPARRAPAEPADARELEHAPRGDDS